MPPFLGCGSIFLRSTFFHHLALSETDFSNHHRLNNAFSHWYHLYTDIVVKEHDDSAGRAAPGKN